MRLTHGVIFALGLGTAACSGTESDKSTPESSSSETPAPGSKLEVVPPLTNTTINQFLRRGTPTFIAGTAGSNTADEAIDAQIDVIRGTAFPTANVVADVDVDTAAFPPNPVLYGGPHVNALVKALRLPIALGPRRLTLGDQTFEDQDYFVIATIPARPKDGARPAHPELLLFAGTDTPGVTGINAQVPGGAPILIEDRFGVLATGRWKRDAKGRLRAALGARARRPRWRMDDRVLQPIETGNEGSADIAFLESYPIKGEDGYQKAAVRGLQRVVNKLQVHEPGHLFVYVYPDAGSKKSLTGNGGYGHAVVAMRTLHVIANPGLEDLLAHEGTHVLAHSQFGPERTPFLAEGLAVWVAGKYQGQTLEQWRAKLKGRVNAPVTHLLGPSFRKLPEQSAYPVAGLFVGAAVKVVGVDNFGRHLLGADAGSWDEACKRAGTTPAAMQKAFEDLF